MSSTTSSKDDVYRRLQQHLDKMPVGYPATTSGVELRVLKHLFTPVEAELAITLSMILEPVKAILRRAKNLKMTAQEVGQHLDAMVSKGLIHGGKDPQTGEAFYGNAPLIVGFYEYQAGRLTKEFVNDVEEYFDETFFKKEWFESIPQIRTIPSEQSIEVNQSLEFRNEVAAYDDIEKLIENAKPPYSVTECICRQVNDMRSGPCTHSKEVCMQFGGGARWWLSLGVAREISKDEVIKILKKAQNEGLVLQPFNAQKPLGLCCCCGDACGILTRVKQYPRPADLVSSNYYAEVNPDLCTGCGTCATRCHMDAPVVDDVSKINLDRCIGCGVCVSTCPEKAIHMVKKEKQWVPPPNTKELFMEIMKHKANLALQNKQKSG